MSGTPEGPGTPAAVTTETAAPAPDAAPAGRASGEPRPGRYQHTALALIGAVIGCLLVIAFIVIVVVRPDQTVRQPIDWHAAAASAIEDLGPSVVDPQLPDGWTANVAELRKVDDVQTWVIALLSPADGYVEIDQGFGASDVWTHDELEQQEPSGTVTIDGLTWQVVDRRSEKDTGNYAYSLVAELPGSTLPQPEGASGVVPMPATPGSTVILHGTGTDAEFATVATAISTQLRQRTASSGT